MRNLILIAICLLVPVCVAVLNVYAQDKPATVADVAKIENVGRAEQDAKTGIWHVWITLDKDHSLIAKFKTVPTADDIRAVRDKTLAQEADAKAAKDAETAKVAQSEAWKAEGRCPTCGQVLPKDGGK